MKIFGKRENSTNNTFDILFLVISWDNDYAIGHGIFLKMSCEITNYLLLKKAENVNECKTVNLHK